MHSSHSENNGNEITHFNQKDSNSIISHSSLSNAITNALEYRYKEYYIQDSKRSSLDINIHPALPTNYPEVPLTLQIIQLNTIMDAVPTKVLKP